MIDTQISEYLEDRKCALEEMKQAIQAVGANFQRVPVVLTHILLCLIDNYLCQFFYYSLINSILVKRTCWKLSTMRMWP